MIVGGSVAGQLFWNSFKKNGMKRVFFLTMLFMAAIVALAQEKEPATGPRLVFEREAYDFGRISRKDGKVSCEFPFTNQGVAPLVITRIETSCTCTKGTFPKKPIVPGGSGTVTITYDPAQQKGVFFKAIQVYSNGEQRRLIVTVKGEVY